MKEKTYIVNMLKDVKKKEEMLEIMKSHPELDFQIWEAVEGKRLTTAQQFEMILPTFKERYGKNASLPAAGCSLSHIGIYKDIVENNIPHALILEDDARLKSNLHIEILAKLLDSKEPIAILLTPEFFYFKSSVSNIDNDVALYSVYDGYMTSGYMINKAGAKLLLDNIYPVQYVADAWEIFKSFGLVIFGMVPHVISYPDGVGEIGAECNRDNNPYKLIRTNIIKCIFKLLFFKDYIRGCRKSKKKWK